ncbi:MAG: family 78 glycoside hydrolase catalytic domain [Bacteroides sp.]|nr:family 78 glycoside hydrolase catalytic domain [Bacteroides sp.]
MKLRELSCLIFALCCLSIQAAQSVSVSTCDLRVEQLVNPLGIDTPQPRFSWRIRSEHRNTMQTAYRILVASSPHLLELDSADVWDSGRVASDASIWVDYQGKKLLSNGRYYWKVLVETTAGTALWSETAHWSMGLLGEHRWAGRWIGLDRHMPWDEPTRWSRLSARYLRKEFSLKEKSIRQATLHISGLGLYECFINGQRVGDLVLAPAPTDYRKSVFYNTYDVTALLTPHQANAIGVTLGNGRYYTMQQNHRTYKILNFGFPKVRLNLIVEYEDGTRETISTNTDWKLTADGPIRSNNEYDGEEYDARKELGRWSEPGYDDSRWQAAERVSIPAGLTRAQMMPGMRVVERLSPSDIRQQAPGRYIIDMGQNMVGWLRLKRLQGTKGDSIRLRFAETLQADGELYTANLRDAKATDLYILKGGEEEEWAPRFVYHGFRYVEVTGFPGTPCTENFIGEVVNDDMPRSGTLESDHPTLNQTLHNAYWGIRGNYKGMPVDCPQRNERQPWLGDRSMGCLGESFLMDNGPLYAKWMDDIREAQRADGCIPDVAPAYFYYYTDNMTWPVTFLLVGDMLYEQYANDAPIRKHYPAMKLWLQHMQEAYMNEEFILTRDRYGDWCVPPESPELIHSKDSTRITDGRLIATAYFYKSLQLLAKFARLQGYTEDVQEYEALAEKVKTSFNRHYWKAEKGYYSNNTVTANLLPLAFGLADSTQGNLASRAIIDKMVDYYNATIQCGVIGVQWLMNELVRMGRSDVAYVLATHNKYPGWGYMAAKGATTIWELWNGDTADPSMNSGNHVMLLGDLLPFCYRHLAGIAASAPGFKTLKMKPAFELEEVGYIKASYTTPYGEVKSHWTQSPQAYEWQVTIPANTTAEVWLPQAESGLISESGRSLQQQDDITILRREAGFTVCRIGSGSYHFRMPKSIEAGNGRQGILADEFICNYPPFPESHAATIVETKKGLVAAWFGGTKEKNPDCCIWVSRLTKKGWTAPQKVADGVLDGTKYACWNPVLTVTPSGELQLYYKIGVNVAGWSGHVVTSRDCGKTWSRSRALPQGFLGPIKNKPVWIGHRMICPSSTEGKEGWRVHFEISEDEGRTWKMVGPIAAQEVTETDKLRRSNARHTTIQAIQPTILVHPDGALQALCRTQNNGSVASTWSRDGGETWSPLEFIDLPNNNSGIDGLRLQDGRYLLVYNHYRYIAGKKKNRTPINVGISTDGMHWQAAAILEDSPINQYSYPSVIQGKDGKVHIVYTWRRQRIKYVCIDPACLSCGSFEEKGWKE